ncbi:MAG: MarR family transcriptional regulator [Saprospiraceae bacterium]|nr:MarR family transcriptional regulator [Saprospiraceae bacterium]
MPSALPKLAKTAEVSGFILERTAKRMKQFFHAQLTLATADITIDQWIVLQALESGGAQSQFEIARQTFKDAPTVTRILDLLEQKQLISREDDPNDRRRYNVRLTAQGHQKMQDMLPVIKNARQQAWRGLDDDEMATLVRLLDKVYDNLK